MELLLNRIRIINKALQKSERMQYAELAAILSNVMTANVYIVGKAGHVLGYSLLDNFECRLMDEQDLQKGIFPADYAEWLLRVNEVSPNKTLKGRLCAFSENTNCLFTEKYTTIIPIFGGGQRMGTLIVAKFQEAFVDADLVLAEYGAAVVGAEIFRDKSDNIDEEARRQACSQIAVNALSYSELVVLSHICSGIDGTENLFIASQIADKAGIARSVIVNALRKCQSAGLIESKSLGTKGTYIRILNEYFLDQVRKVAQ